MSKYYEDDYPHDIAEYQGPFQDSTISQVSVTEIDKELYLSLIHI